MLGIDFDKSANGLNPATKLSLLNYINELKFGSQFENETVHPGDPVLLQTEESSELIKASCIFEVLGFEQLAKNMRRFYSETLIETMMKEVREEAKAKKIISADRSKAKKGKTNRHQSVALEIATRTWENIQMQAWRDCLRKYTHTFELNGMMFLSSELSRSG